MKLNGKRVFVAGHRGMVGSALLRRLEREDCSIMTTRRAQTDLRRQEAVEQWMDAARPDLVIVAAARVGGIAANDRYPAQFIYDNVMMAANIVHAAQNVGVEKLLLLGSTCTYPKHAAQPIAEASLLTGPLEPTNQWYAIAKIAGIKLCQAYRRQYGCNFIAAQPANLYGPYDNFDPETGHVLPALIRKAHQAKLSGARDLTVWGSGKPLREFLHVDDLADACVFLMQHYDGELPINIGTGEEVTIRRLAEMVSRVVNFDGTLTFDLSKPDGAPRKVADTSHLREMGWHHKTGLAEGIAATYDWFQAHADEAPRKALA